MSLLTPLYIAGVLAVALPVLFHLLRRSPQKQQTFSSLMFLSPTPPQFTRRSRISNWLLLLLRAAVLTLLAIAFARPFFQSEVAVAANGQAGRYVALLVDTSASMRREDLWRQAKQHADAALATLGPFDHAALFFFDRTVRPVLGFEQWDRLDPSQRSAAVRAELDRASPTWAATALGEAVAQAAERVAVAGEPQTQARAVPRSVVLISDLQQGGHAEALQGHAWPETVRLDVRPVVAKSNANAGLQLVRPQADAVDAADDRPRVRIANTPGSDAEQFTLAWANQDGPVATLPAQKIYVPAGRSQVARVDWPPAGVKADRLVLTGDASDFDNTLFVTRPRKATVRVLFAGTDAATDAANNAEGLAFYLRTALGDTPQRQVEVATAFNEPLPAEQLKDADLCVIGRPLSSPSVTAAKAFVEDGGHVLWVLRTAADTAGLDELTGARGLTATESTVSGYALVAKLDTAHPLLAPFADARFGDFSRIHFWKHRVLTVPAGATAKVLAAFDNGEPYLVEFTVGRGRVFVMTSGWQPADSQLALSTKFVPILDGMLRPRGNGLAETQAFIGETFRPPESARPTAWQVRRPDGQTVALSADPFDVPGHYAIAGNGVAADVAVNVRPDESRTTPLLPADFKQWGAVLETGVADAPAVDRQRNAQRAELENRQKLWQWLLVGVLGLVAAETALAGRLAKQRTVATESSTTG